jgi:hypothetical protein
MMLADKALYITSIRTRKGRWSFYKSSFKEKQQLWVVHFFKFFNHDNTHDKDGALKS